MGPGSPTYAIRQLRDSLAWQVIQALNRQGTTLALASAATIAIGVLALPIYEIYKVGEELHWKDGLDFFSAFGLSLVFVPHWNNRDGGDDLDTSRCFMGRARFEPLLNMLPAGMTVVGIDEQTGLLIDLEAGVCRVVGIDGVRLIRGAEVASYQTGMDFSITELGDFRLPDRPTGLPAHVWQRAMRQEADQEKDSSPPTSVLALVEEREAARQRRDWEAADALRARISEAGWRILDTEQGTRLEKKDGNE
jgi:hypothetical protein